MDKYSYSGKNNQIILSTNKKYKSVRQRVETICNFIDKSDSNQNLVLRLFVRAILVCSAKYFNFCNEFSSIFSIK